MNVDTRARGAANDAFDAVDRMQRSQAGIHARAGSIEGFRAFQARRRRAQRVTAVVVAVAIAALGFAGLLRAFRSQPVPADKITPDNVQRLEVAWVGSLPEAPYSSVVGEGYVIAYGLQGSIAAFREDCGSGGQSCDPLWTADVTTGEGEGLTASVPVIANGHVLVAGDRCWNGGRECANDLYSFRLDCRTDGRECSPRSVAPEAGGVLFLDFGSVTTDGRLVYASGNRLDVYRFDCGKGGATCEPEWSFPPGSFSPAVWQDTVVVATDRGRLAAFDVDCGSGGVTCEPLWRGQGDTGEPVMVDGVAYSAGHQVLAAYDVACGTGGDVCEPLWTAVPPENQGFTGDPVVSGGVVYVQGYGFDPSLSDPESHPGSWSSQLVYAFPSTCATGGAPCRPLWTFELPLEQFVQGWGGIVAGLDRLYVVAVANPNTPEESRRLLAFDSRCRADGGECTPDWVAPTGGTPVVGQGLVFVLEGREVKAYASDCGTGGATCEPIWRATVGSGARGLEVEGDKVLVGSKEDGLTVFALDGGAVREGGGS